MKVRTGLLIFIPVTAVDKRSQQGLDIPRLSQCTTVNISDIRYFGQSSCTWNDESSVNASTL